MSKSLPKILVWKVILGINSFCFHFAFTCTDSAKFGRNLVAMLQEHREARGTIRDDLRLIYARKKNTRDLLTRLDKRIPKLRIRRLGVRIPSGAPFQA